ncbi:MAG TPA: glucokinase [Gemmatimonadales bacterium]|nr:glucokinase [Gemmatimonadales bacterium]
MKVLAGDVGGTNARLAVVEVTGATARIVHEQRYPSRSAPTLGPIVRRFLDEAGPPPERACFGIAGPVVDGECRTSNLPWTVSARALAGEIGITATTIINDFEAVGYGVGLLGPPDLVTLQAGVPAPHGTIALIGAGTGLGQGFLVWDGDRYRVHSSEGGHVAFAARDAIEWGLRNTLLDEFGHVSYERILSGSGLARVYQYLAATRFAAEQSQVRREMEAEDPAAVVTRHAVAKDDALSVKALDIFASVYGEQAGSLALTVLATGGVYVAGGIAPRIVPKLKDGGFIAAFRHQGRLSDLAARIPIHVITSPDVGLLGAAACAAR